MARMLYVLTRPLETIDPALFCIDDHHGDVVSTDQGRESIVSNHIVRLSEKTAGNDVSFEDFVEMIFSHDRVIVI